MTIPIWIIGMLTLAECILVALVCLFFLRLRRSETSLAQLQASQEELLDRIYQNTAFEQNLVETFAQRQSQLLMLNQSLEERSDALRRLLEQAEGICRSPQFLREVVLSGHNRGETPAQIAKATGLSADEVEIILAHPVDKR